MATAGQEELEAGWAIPLFLSFVPRTLSDPFLCNFLGSLFIFFLGQAWAEGKGELAT